ncbi:MAG: helix-hairpin-helix domain-containing protein [Candidatus Eisenbacteria bacterium]
MFDLTPGERRGALTLLVLMMLGTAQELWQSRQPPPKLPVQGAPLSGSMTTVGASEPASAPPRPAQAPAGPVDLNHATLQELDALPGIGPVIAGRILAHRARVGRFHSREDLLAVQGIGPKLFARLVPLVSVDGASPSASSPEGPPTKSRSSRPVR